MEELLDATPPGNGRFVALGVLVAVLGLALAVRFATREDTHVLPSPSPVARTQPPVHLVESDGYGSGLDQGAYTFWTSVRSIASAGLTLVEVVALGPDGAPVPGVDARILEGDVQPPEPLPPAAPVVLAPDAEATLALAARPDCARPASVSTLRLTYVAAGATRTFVVTPAADSGLGGLAARACR